MSSKESITDNQLKGNWGEQFIAEKLASQGCLVRHVTQGHDTGIDLYCERVKKGKPYLHFWCQVKTKNRWTGHRKKVKYPADEMSHVEYWLQQPVPVFMFLVPDLRDKPDVRYYICSSLDFYHSGKDGITSFRRIDSSDDLLDFLDNDLPVETFKWDLKEGKVSILKTPNPQYTKSIPHGYAQKFSRKIRRSILEALRLLGRDILEPEILLARTLPVATKDDRLQRAKPLLEALEKLVTDYQDKHYHFYETLGQLYELEQNYTKALYFYETSRAHLKDPKIDHASELWRTTILNVEKSIERVKKKNEDESWKEILNSGIAPVTETDLSDIIASPLPSPPPPESR